MQGVLVLIALGLLLVPLLKLTRAPSSETIDVPRNAMSASAVVAAHATLRFAHPPKFFSVRTAGGASWTRRLGDQPVETEFETNLELKPDAGYVDLEVEVQWPTGTPRTIVELELAPDGSEAATRSAWGEGQLITTFSFPIK